MQTPKRYSAALFAQLVGVSVKTLQRWDRIGTLTAGRTITGRRVYTEAHLKRALMEKAHDDRDAVAMHQAKQLP